MPALGNIAINDGKATPVTHTFAPVSTNGELAQLANRAPSIPKGYETLAVRVRKPGSAQGAYQVETTLVFPVVQTVNGVDTVVRTSKAVITLHLSQDSTTADRKDIRVLLANLLQNSTIATAIENLEPIY
jgi:hypothetical protein